MNEHAGSLLPVLRTIKVDDAQTIGSIIPGKAARLGGPEARGHRGKNKTFRVSISVL